VVPHPHGGCVAFVSRAEGGPVEEAADILVLTLPGTLPKEGRQEGRQGGSDAGDAAAAAADAQGLANGQLLAIQRVTQHAFLPLADSLFGKPEGKLHTHTKLQEGAAGDPAARAAAAPAPEEAKGSQDSQPSLNLKALRSKMRELDLVLSQCRNTTAIPTLQLQPHPSIVRLLREADPKLAERPNDQAPKQARLPPPPADLLADDEFLSSLQLTVNSWIKEIRSLSVLATTTPFPNSASEEVMFWRDLSQALASTNATLTNSANVKVTVSILTQAKRLATTMALESNTQLVPAMEHASDCSSFLTALPLDALLSAASLPEIKAAVAGLFAAYPKIRNSKNYDLDRLAQLLQSTTVTLRDGVSKVSPPPISPPISPPPPPPPTLPNPPPTAAVRVQDHDRPVRLLLLPERRRARHLYCVRRGLQEVHDLLPRAEQAAHEVGLRGGHDASPDAEVPGPRPRGPGDPLGRHQLLPERPQQPAAGHQLGPVRRKQRLRGRHPRHAHQVRGAARVREPAGPQPRRQPPFP
jgi:hypothetical protein